jgi:hypothetical protein
MSDDPTPKDKDEVRVPPDDSAWREAQRSVAQKNDEARKAGRAQREENERKLAATRRARDEAGHVYR